MPKRIVIWLAVSTVLILISLSPVVVMAEPRAKLQPGVYYNGQVIAGQGTFFAEGVYIGGDIVAGGGAITVGKVRWGKHADYERLVFDLYDSEGTGPKGEPVNTQA